MAREDSRSWKDRKRKDPRSRIGQWSKGGRKDSRSWKDRKRKDPRSRLDSGASEKRKDSRRWRDRKRKDPWNVKNSQRMKREGGQAGGWRKMVMKQEVLTTSG